MDMDPPADAPVMVRPSNFHYIVILIMLHMSFELFWL